MREDVEYSTIYEETANTEIYFHSMWEHIRGYLEDYNAEEILLIEKRIQRCKCGGRAQLHEFEGMGDGDYTICCMECGRTLRRSLYDVDIHAWERLLDICIQDWNAGLSSEDIKKMNDAEHERVRLREEDLVWKELYPNNMPENGLEGYYCLLFGYKEGRIYCCKWSIEFQPEETEPGCTYENAPIEAYNLFKERIYEVTGSMGYPEPVDHFLTEAAENGLFSGCGVNRKGDFIRSYRTLEEAKQGAVGRCGWEGMNKDTLIREDEYLGKTAEEVLRDRKK